ncbi:MAG: hypothetical protein ISN64_02955 [Rickettsia sp.]|nr:hypothetical protein [Rickettsia sp.]
MDFKIFNNKIKILLSKKWSILILIFILGFIIGSLMKSDVFFIKKHLLSSNTDNIKLCFTPPSGCGDLVIEEIKNARHDLFMQAYVLTHQGIIDAILYAHNNGVKINILLDYKSYRSNIKGYKLLKSKNINISFDKMNGLAHNKVIIIDKEKVITGSFNFSHAADTRNAENLVIINDKKIAEAFLNNWIERKIVSAQQLSKMIKDGKHK